VLLDNRGFGCINRLQQSTGSPRFNNLLSGPPVDFRTHAESLGAIAEHVSGLIELEQAVQRARSADRTTVIVIDTDAEASTKAGGHWWDVPVPEVSPRAKVGVAHDAWTQHRVGQRRGN
jgi:3D-(3,5/4)-trihydroxycyclohexane-1,2-dione acylhydrolase (decyclizing)